MYEYRKMPPEQRKEILHQRRQLGNPLHAPLRFDYGQCCCLISSACFNHQNILNDDQRRDEFELQLLARIQEIQGSVTIAWAILPNHYHLLLDVDTNQLRKTLGRLHNGIATHWNRLDGAPGRRVWYRFRCDPIRDESHFNQSINYIHKNPMKHGCARKSIDWPWSSLNSWLDALGQDAMRDLWWKYPINDSFGNGWDD